MDKDKELEKLVKEIRKQRVDLFFFVPHLDMKPMKPKDLFCWKCSVRHSRSVFCGFDYLQRKLLGEFI